MKRGKFLGQGAEKIVFEDPYNNSDEYIKKRGKRVYAEIYDKSESENSIKARYYLAKVLEILIPGFYPKLDIAGKDPTGKYYIRAEQLDADMIHKILNYVNTKENQGDPVAKIIYKLASFLSKIRNQDARFIEYGKISSEKGLPKDEFASNFSKHKGKLMSMDIPHPWSIFKDVDGTYWFDKSFDEKLVSAAIEKLPAELRAKCLHNWHRFLELYYEEIEVYKKISKKEIKETDINY
jgi:hypothetical protein